MIAGLIASFSFFTLASVQIISALRLPSSALRDTAIVVIALVVFIGIAVLVLVALGAGIASVVNVLDVEGVIIGGGLGVRLGHPFAKRIAEENPPVCCFVKQLHRQRFV